MGKAINTIISVIVAVGVFIATGNPQLALEAYAVTSAVLGVINPNKAPKPDTTVSSQKQAIPPRVRARGRLRLHGYFALFETATNGKSVDTFAFMDGPADGIEQVYLNDDRITIVGNVVQTLPDKKYMGGNVNAGYTKGAWPNVAFSDVSAIIPGWDANHRGDGIVTGYLIKNPELEKYYTETYPQGDNVEMSLLARWGYQYDPRDTSQNIADDPKLPSMWSGGSYIGSWKWTENPVLHTLNFLVWERGYEYNKRILPTLDYWKTAADICDEPVATIGASAEITDVNAADDTNVALNNVTGLTIGTVITIEANTYTVKNIRGLAIDFTPGLANAQGIGQGVTWNAAGTEPRYRACVTYNATAAEKEVLASHIETFDGWMQERGDGAFVIYAGKVYTPTITIGPDEIINVNLQFFVETENSVEQVKVTYISANHDWTEQECTPWGGENGATRIATLDAQTPSFSQNRRLAKRLMDRTNSATRGSVTTTLAGRKVRGERYIYLNHTEGDITFFSGLVEITKITRNFDTGGLDMDWIAIDPNIDAWNPDTEEGEPAAAGNRVAPEPLEPPTITDAEILYDQSGQDSAGSRISATVTSPLGSSTSLTWYLRYKRDTDSVWNEAKYDDTDPGASVVLVTGFVPTDATLDLQAEYKSGDGRLSGYSGTYIVDTSTDLTAPDPATGITLTNWSDTLDLVTDYIARARSYRWRFYASDGTTLIRTLITAGRTVSYTSVQAATDGARRAYIVKVAGTNGAGAGTEASTGTLTLAAPVAVTGVTATGGASNAEIDFTLSTAATVAGYSVAYSSVSGFDPLTQGTIQSSLGSPTYLQNLAVGTFYAKVAAYDAWTQRPDLLNYSTPEVSFAITTGGGGTGSGGGGGGGGYCPVEDEMILMADGTQRKAGDLAVGDMVWTQHETTMQWGAYPVEAVEAVDSSDVWLALGFRATAGHLTWLSGTWNRHDALGSPVAGTFRVVRITVTDAHTYVCAGVLSHNLKQNASGD